MSVVDDPRIKEKCQTFTPARIVTRMLDMAGYDRGLAGRRVLENSCGDGAFLLQIVERYIRDAIDAGIRPEAICAGLERDIDAFEVDGDLAAVCRERLDGLAGRYGLPPVRWSIRCGDFLDKKASGRYDLVVGNPPYIAYSDLGEREREQLRAGFATCKKGKFDYSYAFVERSYRMLSEGGRLVYIIPSNLFKNVFAGPLRELIKPDLTEVVDFPEDDIFPGVLVSPAIISVQKGARAGRLRYTKIVGESAAGKTIAKDRLGEKWIFDDAGAAGRRVGDHFRVSNSIATLCNRVFLLKGGVFRDGLYWVGEDRVEAGILRRATSTKSRRYAAGREEYIIFPYEYDTGGKLVRYDEAALRARFPLAARYLAKHRQELAARDADPSAAWFEYGRSQALQNMDRRMIMMSSVISEETRAYLLDQGEIPYSGLYIIQTGEIPLEELLEALNGEAFKRYVSGVGVSVSGSSRRITARDVEDYVF